MREACVHACQTRIYADRTFPSSPGLSITRVREDRPRKLRQRRPQPDKQSRARLPSPPAPVVIASRA